MDYNTEPLPPGIMPNFPPNYPFKWRNKVMPDPHPNELRSLGLPVAFTSYGRRRQKGYGGYENCHGFDMAEQRVANDEQQAMQEEYVEEMMLRQNRAQERAGSQDMHAADHSWQPQWGEGQAQHWNGPPHGNNCNFEFNNTHSERRANWFRGQKHNFRGGRSGNMDRGRQMNGKPFQKYDIHHASQAPGDNFAPSDYEPGCEPAEEEVDFQQGRLWYSDEYAAFDDDPDWGCNEGAAAPGYHPSQFSLSAPVPSSIDHYYNLAPQKQSEKKKNGPNVSREVAIARKLNYLRRQFRERVCEVCVVGFPRMEQYHKHLRSHAKCMYPGCQFEACIEVLDDHITREHLLNPAVNTPISDEEYRRQRKNQFPTREKKELQQAMAELQKKRGELLGIKSNNLKIRVDAGKVGRDKKRLPAADDKKKKTKKMRVEKPPKIIGVEENPHETYDNFVVYSRIPEFRGTDAFDEEMGVKSCFADALQNGDVILADVPAFHISDDDEDMHSSSQNREEFSSSSLQEKPCNGLASNGESAIENGNDMNVVHEKLQDVIAGENAKVDVPTCGGALGLLIGGYGSASDSENESTEPTTALDNLPVKRAVSSDEDECITSQYGRVVNNEVNKDDSQEMNAVNSTKLNGQIDDTGMQPKVEKKNRHRRGKRGLKKRKSSSHCSENTRADTSFSGSTMVSNSNGVCDEVEVKLRPESTSMSTHHTSQPSVSASAASRTETRSSLFSHLKAINSRRESESGDDEDDDTKVASKPWHVRNEENLAARCVSQKYKKFRSKYRTSLLEKLLQDEVRFERNVLLQCARYIVDHQFFDGVKLSPNSMEDEAQGDDETSDGSSSDDGSENSSSSD